MDRGRRERDSEPLRLGFVGAGEMAHFAVLPALHLAPIRLGAVCDLDPERARSAALKFGAPRWYADCREMWRREDLEAVVVQMHPSPRQPIVLEALAAGLHVFVPKPPAPTLAATRELAAAARRADRVLMVNFQRRFSFGVRRARELVAEPGFGELTQLLLSFCSGAYDDVRGRDYDGPVHAYVLDFAVHHLDLLRYLGGEVGRLSVFHRQDRGRVALAVAAELVSGAVATLQLNSGRVWWRNYDRIELTGEGQYVVLDGLWSVRHYTGEENTFTENYSDQRSAELTGDGLAVAEFAAAIREGREPVASIHDAVETMRLYQAVYDAVRENRDGELAL